jgi:hypothetical protein
VSLLHRARSYSRQVRADSTKITEVGVTPVPIWQTKQLPSLQNKEPSVPVRSDSPPACPSAQSQSERRAISLAGHQLTTGIWLEHQLRNTPTARTVLVAMSGGVRSPLRRLRSVALQFTQLNRKQPLPTAELAVVAR